MSNLSQTSIELYEEMQRMGYPEDFCLRISQLINTDFTARRMLGYLAYYDKPTPEMVADEMLAILSDRQRIIEKKQLEADNAAWNAYMERPRTDEE